MIVGMHPIALGSGERGKLCAPVARAAIGGLLTSTLLTLIVVVCAYLNEATVWLRGWRTRRRPVGITEGAAA